MYDFKLPDYKGGSIVNLMSSISNNFGQKHSYNELKFLSSSDLKKFKNVVLIVVDGLGYNYLQKQKDSFLFKNLDSKITSAFLPTTACSNTAFSVGYPPQQHALTGWDMNLKEVGAITTILPFTPIYGGESLDKKGFDVNQIMDIKSFHKGFNADSYYLINKKLAHSSFTKYVSKDVEVVPTNSLGNVFTKIKRLVKKKSVSRKFIHVYISDLDSAGHKEGIKSSVVNNIFGNIDKTIQKLTKSLKGTNTKLIVVADHGMINTPKKNALFIEDFNGLKECLTVPLAGESRWRDCFVRPRKVKDFERIVKKELSDYCWCYKGEQLIKDNFYGLGKPNPRLFDRVGDYVLIMKGSYFLKDLLSNKEKGKKSKDFLGKHGGVSEDELFVPLITVDC